VWLIIVAATLSGPLTLGLSLPAAAALTGVEIALIILAVALGIGVVLAIWKNYEEVEFNAGPPARMILRKKQK
jgi:hypothetical protein